MFRDGVRLNNQPPVDVRIGEVADGEFLMYDEATRTIIGGSGGGGANFGTATIDFGASFTDSASVVVTGQAWVTANSHIHAWFQDDSTADNTAGEHETAQLRSARVVTARSPGVGFTIDCYLEGVDGQGQFTIHWEGA